MLRITVRSNSMMSMTLSALYINSFNDVGGSRAGVILGRSCNLIVPLLLFSGPRHNLAIPRNDLTLLSTLVSDRAWLCPISCVFPLGLDWQSKIVEIEPVLVLPKYLPKW